MPAIYPCKGFRSHWLNYLWGEMVERKVSAASFAGIPINAVDIEVKTGQFGICWYGEQIISDRMMDETYDLLVFVQHQKSTAARDHCFHIPHQVVFGELSLAIVDGYGFPHFEQFQRPPRRRSPEKHHGSNTFGVMPQDGSQRSSECLWKIFWQYS